MPSIQPVRAEREAHAWVDLDDAGAEIGNVISKTFDAHERAASEALQELEAHAGVRVRKGGANENRTTGNLVLAVYHHDTSRELDPQIHTHAVASRQVMPCVSSNKNHNSGASD